MFIYECHYNYVLNCYGALTIMWSYSCLLSLCSDLRCYFYNYWYGLWNLMLVVLSKPFPKYGKKRKKMLKMSNIMELISWCLAITLLICYFCCCCLLYWFYWVIWCSTSWISHLVVALAKILQRGNYNSFWLDALGKTIYIQDEF